MFVEKFLILGCNKIIIVKLFNKTPITEIGKHINPYTMYLNFIIENISSGVSAVDKVSLAIV
jgi:hypothetical protein